MRKRFLLMATAIVTALFVSGQSVAVNAEEKPVTESAEVITEETKSVQNEEIQEETKESVSTQKKLAGDSIGTATAISLGSTYNGSITSSNTKDFYKFTLSSSGRITISANARMNWIYYKIYDSSGEELWSINPSWNS